MEFRRTFEGGDHNSLPGRLPATESNLDGKPAIGFSTLDTTLEVAGLSNGKREPGING
jgi:hypothetical protein